jgi:ABC-type protease/lipase transport system fused ATPase/permease subunit
MALRLLPKFEVIGEHFLISRTLIYALLSALLVLTYLALVFGLQFVFQGITRDSPVLIVISTLAVAALFQPLRQAIQRTIDRSFYRRKYNAEQVLSNFGATLYNELDLA